MPGSTPPREVETQEALDCWSIRGLKGIIQFIENRPCTFVTDHTKNLAMSYRIWVERALDAIVIAPVGEAERVKPSPQLDRWFEMGLEFFLGFLRAHWDDLSPEARERCLRMLASTRGEGGP